MTKYTFSLKNNPSTFYAPEYKSTNYSKILDDLIIDDIKKKNEWLNCGTTNSCPFANTCIKTTKKSDNLLGEIHYILNKKDAFEEACEFLSNYNTFNCPFKKNTLYKIDDNMKFMILIDGILINDKMFFFDDFSNLAYLNTLSANTKKTIATIYTDGLKITIKK